VEMSSSSSSTISGFPVLDYVLQRGKSLLINVLRTGPVPQHIAIVMDGNRRFARKRRQETWEGHNAGFEALASILEFSYQVGVKAMTVFAFSIENFKRPPYEVEALMELVKSRLIQICENGDLVDQYGIRIQVIGDKSLLPEDVREVAERAESMTAKNSAATLNLCFPYTSRDDIATAIQNVVSLAEKDKIDPESIDEETLQQNMYTRDSPPLDILIRTSGVERLSDFMLWESQRETMIEFVPTLWPDFNCWHLFKILLKWGYLRSSETPLVDEDELEGDEEFESKKLK
jgi:ditrans,polycis-polyprenyl diphosphate synthase